jgi:nitrite reductase/ring-hydroxylating ferredoxin subunit
MAARERLICASDQLVEAGRGLRFVARYLGATAQAFAVRHRGVARGYLNRCAHVPVEMDYELGEFFDQEHRYLICSVHGALYDPVDGACLLGRCNGRGLIAVELVERDGAVYLLED